MKAALGLLSLVSIFTFDAAASTYGCSVLEVSQDGPRVLGSMEVTPSEGRLEKVVVNELGDFAACGGAVDQAGGTAQLLCLFADKESQLRVDRSLLRGRVSVMKFNRRTGEFGMTPIAVTDDGAPNLGLVLPSARTGKIYAAVCEKTSGLRRRR